MPYRFDLHVRLEAIHSPHDPAAVRAALRAEVHDPVWFLGRQWQLGEHRGRDAASPALVHVTVIETPVTGPSTAPEDDPRITPPEAIIESEPEQWWTIGRRVRVGRALRSAVPAGAGATIPISCSPGSARHTTGSTVACSTASRCTGSGPRSAWPTPCSPPRACRPSSPPTTGNPPSSPTRRRSAAGPVTLSIPQPRRRRRRLVLGHCQRTAIRPLPRRRWCAPATRHASPTTARHTRGGGRSRTTATTRGPSRRTGRTSPRCCSIHVTASHGDDWFTAPLLSPTGTLVAVTGMEVDDVMGLTTTSRPVADWSMFHVSGRRPGELLIWPTVANPLTGTSALDEVLLGIDEDANVLWAVEQRVDGIELVRAGRTGRPMP